MTNVFQFDDVTVSLIGPGAKAVLGYTDGRFANRSSMSAAFPKALKTFLTVTGADLSADGVDSETGDAQAAAVIAFCHAKISQGKRPIVYTFLANMQPLLNEIFAAGIPRSQLILMCAHVTGVPHICGPQCGFGLQETVDATQFTFTAENRSLDESWCTPAYFDRDLVPPAPVDPHGYLRFRAHRPLVERYDLLRRHRIKNRKQLRELESELQGLADSLALRVIHEAKKSGKPRDWSVNHRGWRYQQLVRRAHGKRVVR